MTGCLIRRPRERRVWCGWSRLVLVLWGLLRSEDSSGHREFDWEIRRSIYWRLSGILTCWEITWDLHWNILLVTGLVLVASPSGYNPGIIEIKIYTTVESCSTSYKRDY